MDKAEAQAYIINNSDEVIAKYHHNPRSIPLGAYIGTVHSWTSAGGTSHECTIYDADDSYLEEFAVRLDGDINTQPNFVMYRNQPWTVQAHVDGMYTIKLHGDEHQQERVDTTSVRPITKHVADRMYVAISGFERGYN